MKSPLIPKQRIIWRDKTEYFLTSSTFLHYPYFQKDEQKQIVLNKIKQIKQYLHVPILAYSIAINHLHLKFYLEEGNLMTQLKIILHSGISREYHKKYQMPYKEFWGSSRTYFINDEATSLKVTGYIIGNLLKHREVSTFNELEKNPFCSYRLSVKKFGNQTIQDLVRNVIDVNEDNEGTIDVKEIKEINLGDICYRHGRPNPCHACLAPACRQTGQTGAG